MSSSTMAKDYLAEFKILPVPGNANVSVIRVKASRRRPATLEREKGGGEITAKDWDKFEKDIADAFEQIP